MQGKADGDGDTGADHQGGEAADGVADGAFPGTDGDDDGLQEADVELLADGVEDGADKQGAEQALGHGPEGVDSVALAGEQDVLPLKERFELTHGFSLSVSGRSYRILPFIIPVQQRLSTSLVPGIW